MIRSITHELEVTCINEGIIEKKLSNKGFKMLCNSLRSFEEGNEHPLTMNDIDFLKDYYDLSRFY